jgi:hypothetical protein
MYIEKILIIKAFWLLVILISWQIESFLLLLNRILFISIEVLWNFSINLKTTLIIRLKNRKNI